MQAGYFNMTDYMNRLNESEDGNIETSNKDGIIIPDENKKAYDWLKKEYNSNQIETKVEITNGSNKATKPTEFIDDKNPSGDGSKSDFKGGEFSTDQKNLGDGSKSDFKPFNGGGKSDTSTEKKETEDTSKETPKKKVSINGIKPGTGKSKDKIKDTSTSKPNKEEDKKEDSEKEEKDKKDE